MFGFSFLIFYGVLAIMNISSAQDPPWNCSFGSFDQPVEEQDEPCSICLAERKSEPFYWFLTDKVSSFGENQPYFRAALSNPGGEEGSSATCKLLNTSLPTSNGWLLSFRYIFNSHSPNERHGYFNYSVCKDEGTVHPLHVVEGWALRQHSFNCSDVEISFKAVRGYNFTNIAIDDVAVVQQGYLEARFNRFNLSRNQSEVSLTKKISGRRVSITFSWQYQGEHGGGADLLDVFACENRTHHWTPDPKRARNQSTWYEENISLSCDSTTLSIIFKAKRISPYISVLLDDIRIYDLSVSVQSTSSSGNIQTLSFTTPTTAILSTTGKTKLQTEVASSLVVRILLAFVTLYGIIITLMYLHLRRFKIALKQSVSEREGQELDPYMSLDATTMEQPAYEGIKATRHGKRGHTNAIEGVEYGNQRIVEQTARVKKTNFGIADENIEHEYELPIEK